MPEIQVRKIGGQQLGRRQSIRPVLLGVPGDVQRMLYAGLDRFGAEIGAGCAELLIASRLRCLCGDR